jgi:DNA repair protein RadD
MITLRPYQSEAIGKLRQSLASGHRAPLLVMPTGSGKTVTFCYMTHGIIQKRKRVVLMCHRSELQDQISATLQAFDVPHGRIAAGERYDPRHLAHVASVQTLARRLDRTQVPDYAIIDEAHHAVASSQYGQILQHWRAVNPNLRVIGFSASPQRLSGEGLGETFDDLILGPSPSELITLGALCGYRIFGPATQIDTSGLHSRAGDFAKDETEALMDKPSVTGDAVSHYRKLCDGAPAVAFCVSVAHAESVAAQFREAGCRAASVDGKMDKQLRSRLIREFAAGEIQVLTSCDLISEGFDVPGIVAAILLRPTQSLALYLQQVGRALRPAAGKPHAIILDHAGNHLRHGLPDDEREWSLDGQERSKRGPKAIAPVRQCPMCYAISRASATACRECGQPFPSAPREIEQRDGELAEVDRDAVRAQQEAERLARKREQGSAKTLDQLLIVEKAKGYKTGWAQHVHAARLKKQGAAA